MDAVTVISDLKDDQSACAADCRAVEMALAEAKEQDAWKRFGMLSFEEYTSWILGNLPVIRRA
jgi:hypothetical protein